MEKEIKQRLKDVMDISSGLFDHLPSKEQKIIKIAIETAYNAGKNDALEYTLDMMRRQGPH